MSDNPQQQQRIHEDEIPGSAFAGCLWCVAIMFFLALFGLGFLVVAWLTDKGEAQMVPDFSPSASESR
ncbi:MAG: hypothetical protein KA004_17375 [Verrucomicrobiales bacterium]|nr:hypothetical protein [Verrucomicrobiales bacterium]